MPVCAAVLHVDPLRREGVLARLRADARLTVGEPCGARVPLVLDTPDLAADAEAWDEVLGIEGALHLDIVFAAESVGGEEGDP